MITINSELLELIENEILQNEQPTYQRIIPIADYTFETKKTLDVIVEKYGGFINRYDDKIIMFINYSTRNFKKPQHEENHTKNFEQINLILNRLNTIEEKIEEILEIQNRLIKDSGRSVISYMNYFKTKDNRKETNILVDEIINHH